MSCTSNCVCMHSATPDWPQHNPIPSSSSCSKVATQIKQYKDRIVLHLPSAYPFKRLLWTLTERLFLARLPATNSS
uniref:Uncharacterized protein n=1 Tax=mine drainage metagenome TaxID=410659 RepID=E6QVL5_9ZZZZ